MKLFKKEENLILLTYVLLLLIASCDNKNRDSIPDEKTKNKIEFNIDSSLLSTKVENKENRFYFCPPKNWAELNSKDFGKFLLGFNEKNNNADQFRYEPIYLFLNNENKSGLVISKLIDSSKSGFYSQIDIIKKSLLSKFDSTHVKGDIFYKDSLQIAQFLVMREKFVNFKILFYNKSNNLFQFDYIIPKEIYSSEIKPLESSIGSIGILNQ